MSVRGWAEDGLTPDGSNEETKDGDTSGEVCRVKGTGDVGAPETNDLGKPQPQLNRDKQVIRAPRGEGL